LLSIDSCLYPFPANFPYTTLFRSNSRAFRTRVLFHVFRKCRLLHLKPYSAHQCKRVAFFNDTGMETVIENHAAVFEMILEVKIHGTGREGISEFGKSQIVSSNQADRRTVDKPTDDGLGADSTIVRIRAVQDLVQKKEHWHLFRKLHNVVQTLNLSIEARRSF